MAFTSLVGALSRSREARRQRVARVLAPTGTARWRRADVGISEDGELSLTVGGTSVRSGSDPDLQAWNFTGPRGELVVSTPGGGLAVWDARQ